MKCGACGYKYKEYDHELEEEVSDELESYVASKDFTLIEGHFTREVGDWYKAQEKVNLYACPVCNTVQMERR